VKRTTTDALEIMDREFLAGKPERISELEQIRAELLVAADSGAWVCG
jgi:hypothetical protein